MKNKTDNVSSNEILNACILIQNELSNINVSFDELRSYLSDLMFFCESPDLLAGKFIEYKLFTPIGKAFRADEVSEPDILEFVRNLISNMSYSDSISTFKLRLLLDKEIVDRIVQNNILNETHYPIVVENEVIINKVLVDTTEMSTDNPDEPF